MEAAAPFAEPLDYAAIGCHDYPKVVKHPMDLGTIKSKLGDGSYQRGEDVLKDVRRLGQLHARCTAYHMRTVCAPHAHRMRTACTHQVRRVFDNCYLYNGAVTTGHWVSLKANEARSRRDLAAISRLPAAAPHAPKPPRRQPEPRACRVAGVPNLDPDSDPNPNQVSEEFDRLCIAACPPSPASKATSATPPSPSPLLARPPHPRRPPQPHPPRRRRRDCRLRWFRRLPSRS